MIRRITLENFMSHKRTVIEPAEGLTVLSGPNNVGKSAVVVALQTLCYNEPSQVFIRHGEKEARILVETDDGHKIEWARKSGKVSYKINGREVHRVGRGGVPDDLHDLLRLPRVESEDPGDDFEIHFAEQKSPIFLLDEPGSRAARFFASSSDAGLLMRMQQRHRQNTADKKAEERLLSNQVNRAEQSLKMLDGVPLLEARVGSLEKEHVVLKTSLSTTAHLKAMMEGLIDCASETSYQSDSHSALSSLESPPATVDTSGLSNLICSLELRESDLHLAGNRCAATASLREVPALAETSDLAFLIDEMQADARAVATESDCLEVGARLVEPPDQRDPSELLMLLQRIAETENKIEAHNEELAHAQEAQLALHRTAEDFVRKNPTCPVCGGKVEAEKLLAVPGYHSAAVHAGGLDA